MPSKTELKEQVKDLAKKLRKATDTIQMSGKMVEIPLTPEGKAVEPRVPEDTIVDRWKQELIKERETVEILQERKARGKAGSKDNRDLQRSIDTHQREIKQLERSLQGHGMDIRTIEVVKPPAGNPIACATELKKIESDIAAGKTHWDIAKEQYDRWERGANACLPCEKSYTEVKSALTGIGIQSSGVIHPEDLRLEDIAASVREQTAKEISAAEWGIRELEVRCGIKLLRVRSRITKLKPLAHVGRWDEFMNNQRQLLKDFELDIRETIPDIKVRVPSYAVPAPVREIKAIVPQLSEYERGQLVKTLTPEEQAQLGETKEFAGLGATVTVEKAKKKVVIKPPKVTKTIGQPP